MTYDFVGYGSNQSLGSALKCQNTPIELMIYFICEVVLIFTENGYLLFICEVVLIITENGYLFFIYEVVLIVTENRYLLLKIFSHLP